METLQTITPKAKAKRQFVPMCPEIMEYISCTNLSKSRLAKAMRVTIPFVCAIARGERDVPVSQSIIVEQATGISRKKLRAKDWQKYWPDA